jgi:serine phosphatase RsbU (regulator of sigma subunit)
MNDDEKLKELSDFLVAHGVHRPQESTGKVDIDQLHEQFKRFMGMTHKLEEEVRSISQGKLNERIDTRSRISSEVRNIQSALRHIVWQAGAVAEGDLSIEIYGLGKLGEAFNNMARKLREDRDIIESKNAQLERQNVELEEAYRALDFELKAVSDIQMALLPRRVPSSDAYSIATYYRTASRSGGDYYDFFPLSDGDFGILVADVSGHGAPAAVIMAMTRLLMHTFAAHLERPEKVLGQLNKWLEKNIMSGQFVTALYGVYEQKSGRFHFASAGHDSPLVCCGKTDEVFHARSPEGLPLGLEAEAEFEPAAIEIAPKSCVLFWTDGLTDVQNKSGEMFETERLRKTLCDNWRGRGKTSDAEKMKEGILSEVEAFMEGVSPKDDITLVVLERRA